MIKENMISCSGDPPTDPGGGPRSSLAQERKCHTFEDEMVQAMNRFSCQKSGGQFEPTAFTKLSYCIFCKVGTCLGPSCLGQEKKKPPNSKLRTIPVTTTLPGMKGETTLTTNTLTEIKKTSSKMSSQTDLLSFSDLFQMVSKPLLISSSKKSKRKHAGKQLRTVFSICSTTAYNVDVLQHLLLSCGSKRKSSKSSSSSSTTSSQPPVAMKAFSLFRKLNVSEVSPKKKKKSLTGKVVETSEHKCLQSSTWMTCQSLPPALGAWRVAWCQGTLSTLWGAP